MDIGNENYSFINLILNEFTLLRPSIQLRYRSSIYLYLRSGEIFTKWRSTPCEIRDHPLNHLETLEFLDVSFCPLLNGGTHLEDNGRVDGWRHIVQSAVITNVQLISLCVWMWVLVLWSLEEWWDDDPDADVDVLVFSWRRTSTLADG